MEEGAIIWMSSLICRYDCFEVFMVYVRDVTVWNFSRDMSIRVFGIGISIVDGYEI